MNDAIDRDQIAAAFKVRGGLIATLESIERSAGWALPSERLERVRGAGAMGLLHGDVFEKAGVNFSLVEGEFSPEFAKSIPGAQEDPRFWASGVSVVIHPANPHVPAAHMNIRHLVTTERWFGGGADLTPVYPDDQETGAFHAALKAHVMPPMRATIPSSRRGVIATFICLIAMSPRRGRDLLDRLRSGSIQDDSSSRPEWGAPLGALYSWRAKTERSFTHEQRQDQLIKRRYVEFNLLHDRGTSWAQNGRQHWAILMSLPPMVAGQWHCNRAV